MSSQAFQQLLDIVPYQPISRSEFERKTGLKTTWVRKIFKDVKDLGLIEPTQERWWDRTKRINGYGSTRFEATPRLRELLCECKASRGAVS